MKTTRTVTVRRRLKASAPDLFAVMTDPGLFAQVPGIRSVDVLTTGASGPASVGTVRRVNLPAGHLVEEIVGIDAPRRFEYLIRDAAVPFDHLFGQIEFHDRGKHADVVWTSTFMFNQALIGPALAGFAALGSHAAFVLALRGIERTARRINTTKDS